MNFTTLKTGVKASVLALVHEAEEQILGEKQGPQRKAWVIATLKGILNQAGVYGKKLFGVFSFDSVIDASLSYLVDWAAAKLKTGFDALEKL